MNDGWAYQIRVYLSDNLAAVVRTDPGNVVLQPLMDMLAAHQATMKCQLESFAEYVAEAEARGVGNFPLYKWSKATLDDPEKRAKHARSFAVRIENREVYERTAADRLEADLQTLAGRGLITGVSRHDTNPANNMPVPQQFRS